MLLSALVSVRVVALQAEIELTLNRAYISNAKVFFYTSRVDVLIYQYLGTYRAFRCSSWSVWPQRTLLLTCFIAKPHLMIRASNV